MATTNTTKKHSIRWYNDQIAMCERQASDWFALAELARARNMNACDVARFDENAAEFESEAELIREQALDHYSIDQMVGDDDSAEAEAVDRRMVRYAR